MFPTAVCTFRSGEYTFRSGERTYRSAEHRIDTCSYKIIIALVNTLRQLLSHIHYYYPHTITIPILFAYARTRTLYKFSISSITSITNRFKYHIIRYLSSDRRCDRSDRRCDKSDIREAFLLNNHAKLIYFHLIFPSFQYYAALIRT